MSLWRVLLLTLATAWAENVPIPPSYATKGDTSSADFVTKFLAEKSDYGDLLTAFQDTPKSRCGYRWNVPGDMFSFNNQTALGRGFAETFTKFSAVRPSEAEALLSNTEFLVKLLEALEHCDYRGPPKGPRAVLEMVAVVKSYPQHKDNAALKEFLEGISVRWGRMCGPGSEGKPLDMDAVKAARPKPTNAEELREALGKSQLLSYYHGHGNPMAALFNVALDGLTAMNGHLTETKLMTTVSYFLTFLFDGPSIEKEGFVAGVTDIMCVNRLSHDAATEALLGSLHRTWHHPDVNTRRYHAAEPLFVRLPSGLQQARSPPSCYQQVTSFMEASRGIKRYWTALAAPDTGYTEFWFVHARLSGFVGLIVHLNARMSEQYANETIPVIQAARLNDFLQEKLGRTMLVHADRDRDFKQRFIGSTTFKVPDAATLMDNLRAGTLSPFDVKFFPRSSEGLSLWAAKGEAHVSLLKATNSWHEAFDDDANKLTEGERIVRA